MNFCSRQLLHAFDQFILSHPLSSHVFNLLHGDHHLPSSNSSNVLHSIAKQLHTAPSSDSYLLGKKVLFSKSCFRAWILRELSALPSHLRASMFVMIFRYCPRPARTSAHPQEKKLCRSHIYKQICLINHQEIHQTSPLTSWDPPVPWNFVLRVPLDPLDPLEPLNIPLTPLDPPGPSRSPVLPYKSPVDRANVADEPMGHPRRLSWPPRDVLLGPPGIP